MTEPQFDDRRLDRLARQVMSTREAAEAVSDIRRMQDVLAALVADRDSWQKVAREYESALADRSLL